MLRICDEARFARIAGLDTFESINPCVLNPSHSIRFAKGGACVACRKECAARPDVRAKARAYYAKYRLEHPDRVHTAVTRWHKANPDRIRAIRIRYEQKKHPGYQPMPRNGMVAARKAAKARGEKMFTLDTPCPRGHMSPRRVCNARCVECCRLDQLTRRRCL